MRQAYACGYIDSRGGPGVIICNVGANEGMGQGLEDGVPRRLAGGKVRGEGVGTGHARAAGHDIPRRLVSRVGDQTEEGDVGVGSCAAAAAEGRDYLLPDVVKVRGGRAGDAYAGPAGTLARHTSVDGGQKESKWKRETELRRGIRKRCRSMNEFKPALSTEDERSEELTSLF